jgi:hypothetical protein
MAPHGADARQQPHGGSDAAPQQQSLNGRSKHHHHQHHQQQQQHAAAGASQPPVIQASASFGGSSAGSYYSAGDAASLHTGGSSAAGAPQQQQQQLKQQQEQEQRSGKATHAGLRAQAGALYRKNAVYQRRNACSNVCLLSAPIFFCLMLLGIQVAINRLLLTGEDYECGCQCTRCCFQGNPNNCSSVARGTCSFECLERNRSACGVQFSTPRQSIFCAIPHTSAWPPILQVRWCGGPSTG